MKRFTSFLTRYVRGKQRTLKYEFAVAAFAIWVAFTIRLALSGDAAWIMAQSGNYSTLSTTVFAFILAAVGLQAWQNAQTPAASDPAYETGDVAAEPTAEDRARGGQ
jgi:hypothetical protein